MTRDTLLADLQAATQIAKDARDAPLMGGSIGLMWASLAAIALLIHGSVLQGWGPIDVGQVGIVWALYGAVGGILSFWLSRRIASRSTDRTFANRAAEAGWVAGGVMIAAIAIGLVIGTMAGQSEIVDFNYIVPFAFMVSAVVNGMLARLTGHGYLVFAAIIAGLATISTLLSVRAPEMYFMAAVFILFSGVIPSLIELRRAK